MSYYYACPHCGAHLDSGERCDCIGSLYASLSEEDRQLVDAKISELLRKQRAPASAANAGEGKVEKGLRSSDSASIMNEMEEEVK